MIDSDVAEAWAKTLSVPDTLVAYDEADSAQDIGRKRQSPHWGLSSKVEWPGGVHLLLKGRGRDTIPFERLDLANIVPVKKTAVFWLL